MGYWSYLLTDTEREYSPTERECYAVVWAVTTLRPYIEGTRFTVRTDHDRLRWLMNFTDANGRLCRWRLRLLQYDFDIEYRPGRVHQVPDALSRLLTPAAAKGPVDDDIPTFEKPSHAPSVVDERSARETLTTDTVLVTTRSGTKSPADAGEQRGKRGADKRTTKRRTRSGRATPAISEDLTTRTNALDVFDDDVWDDCDDVDVFDFARGLDEKDLPELDAVPRALTWAEIIDAQKSDDFCQTTLRNLSANSPFFEDDETGALMRRHPNDPSMRQIVLPHALRGRLLHLAHHTIPAGHPGQNKMYYTLRQWYYWPHMAADVMNEVRNCSGCAKNRLRLRRHLNRLKLFPATRPLEDVAIDILGPLPRTKHGKEYILVITDRFSKLVAAVPMSVVNAFTVAVAFCEAWVFKYGPPRSLLSDNGPQFAARLFQIICQRLGIRNLFASAYHPQTNGQVERYNRTVLAMLRNYINEHRNDWDQFVSGLVYAYNMTVHRTTKTTPFELVLSRPPPPFTLQSDSAGPRKASRDAKADFIRRIENAIANAGENLRRVQERYKADFDSRVRRVNAKIAPGDYVYVDVTDGSRKLAKLETPAKGPYRVVSNDTRTMVIDRDGVIERVSADRVVYAPPPPNGNRDEPLATAADLATKNATGPQYVVEDILAHGQSDDGTMLFRVKWAGYAEPDWQPRSNLPEEMLSRYFQRVARQSRRALA